MKTPARGRGFRSIRDSLCSVEQTPTHGEGEAQETEARDRQRARLRNRGGRTREGDPARVTGRLTAQSEMLVDIAADVQRVVACTQTLEVEHPLDGESEEVCGNVERSEARAARPEADGQVADVGPVEQRIDFPGATEGVDAAGQ